MGNVFAAAKVVIDALAGLDEAEQGRLIAMVLGLRGDGITVTLGSAQAGPAAQEQRKPGRPRKSNAAKPDPKGSGATRSGRSSARAKHAPGTCPDHRDRILQLLKSGPKQTSEITAALSITEKTFWQWRISITKLQQDGKVSCQRSGRTSLWSLA